MMSASAQILAARTMSAFELSIGTSFSLETLFKGPRPTYDPDRVPPPSVSIEDYDEFWVNTSTLYRNILQAVPTAAEAASVLPGDVLDALLQEMEMVRDVVGHFTNQRIPVVFYRSHYYGMERAHPHAKLRMPKTPKQIHADHERELVLHQLFKAHFKDFGLRDFRRALEPSGRKKALLISHYAYDLLSAPQFKELHLLESHTGLVKKNTSFYTKFTKPSNGVDLVRIPFNVATIQVFGDSQTFAPMAQEIRQQVIALAEEYKWHSMTTKDRLRLSFELMKDRFTGEILKTMLNESI